jgi:hypothetical protein
MGNTFPELNTMFITISKNDCMFWSEKPKGRYHLEDLEADGKILE